MKRLLPVSFFLLAACDYKYEAPRPPTWDDECQPSDPYYLELAQGTQFMAEEGEIPDDPHMALEKAYMLIEEWDVEIEKKAEGIEAWEKFNTTFPTEIYVKKTFDFLEVPWQAIILWHEIVHLREYEEMKPKKFYEHYAFAEGRWALEVQGYREGFRLMRKFGMSEAAIQEKMDERANSLYDGYEMGAMKRECAVGLAIEIWSLDSP